MANIAKIGFEADTSDLKDAEKDLDRLVPAAGRAGQASDTLSTKFNKMGDTLSSKVTSGLGLAKTALVGFAAGILGALSAGALVASLGNIADRLDDVSKAAKKLQVDPGDLQSLGYAADLAGISFDSLATVANKMNRVIGLAIAKGKEGSGVFKLLGISAKTLSELPIDERFAVIADRMKEMNVTAEQQALILGQLGDRSGSLSALFEGGSEAIREAGEQLDRFGGKLQDQQAGNDVEAMNDAFTTLTYAIQSAGNQMVVFLSRTGITQFVNGLAEIIGWFNRSKVAAAAFGTVVWSVFNALLLGIPTLISNLVAIWPKVSSAAKTAANFVINAFTGMFGYIKALLSNVPAIFSAAFYGGAAVALKAINNFVQNAIKLFNNLAAAVGAAFGAELGDAVDPSKYDLSGSDVFKAIQKRSDAANSVVADAFKDANSAFSSTMAVDHFKEVGMSADKTKDDIDPATNSVTNFGNALDETGNKAGGAAEKLTELQGIAKELDKLGAPFDQAKSAFDKLTELQKNGIVTGDQYTAMLGRIEQAFIAAGGTADQWSKIITTKTNDMTAALKDFSTNALTSVGDTIADLAVDGKADFKALADGIMKDLIRMMWQALVVKPIIGSLFGFEAGGAFGGGGVLGFANGGTFTNKVYNRPTPFKFASGGGFAQGVMGEAGPEAVMPLKRGRDGSLGIEAHGGSTRGQAANSNVVSIGDININVEPTGDEQADQRAASMYADAFKDRVYQIANEAFGDNMRYGGAANPRGSR